MLLAGVCYAAIGVALVIASYTTDGWLRWPIGILGWLLLVAGTWTLLFRVFLGFLVTSIRRIDRATHGSGAK